jgi:hypothetical protein
VFRANGRSTGHVAVVRRVVDSRLLVVDHANWLDGGQIFEATPVRDVSPGNDWTAVQVWYIPGQSWGVGTYRTYGFVYPRAAVAAGG